MNTNMHLCVKHVLIPKTSMHVTCMVYAVVMVGMLLLWLLLYLMATTLLCEALLTTWEHLQYVE